MSTFSVVCPERQVTLARKTGFLSIKANLLCQENRLLVKKKADSLPRKIGRLSKKAGYTYKIGRLLVTKGRIHFQENLLLVKKGTLQ